MRPFLNIGKITYAILLDKERRAKCLILFRSYFLTDVEKLKKNVIFTQFYKVELKGMVKKCVPYWALAKPLTLTVVKLHRLLIFSPFFFFCTVLWNSKSTYPEKAIPRTPLEQIKKIQFTSFSSVSTPFELQAR